MFIINRYKKKGLSSGVDLKKAGILYLIGTFFNQGLGFITVPVFTRILSTGDYGMVNTYNSWVSIISMVMGMALHMGVRAAFIDYEDKVEYVLSSIISFTLLLSFFSMLISTIVIGVTGNHIEKNLVTICILHSAACAIIQDYLMYLMMRYWYIKRTVLMVLPNFLSIVVSIYVILYILDSNLYLGRIVSTATIQVLCAIIICFITYRGTSVLINKEYIFYALRISAPLVLHGVALNILSQSDRVMITSLRNSSETGIYSLIYNFGMLGVVATNALEGIWVPWFTNKMKEREYKEINNYAKKYILFITAVIVCLVLFGPEVVKLLADSKYWIGIRIIPPIVIANYIVFAYTFYVNVEHYFKKTVVISRNTIIAAISNIVLNLLFIPRFGYIAAAYTTLASYLICMIFHAFYSKRIVAELYPISLFVKNIVPMAMAIVCFYSFLSVWYIRWILGGLYLMIILFKERHFIISAIRKKEI